MVARGLSPVPAPKGWVFSQGLRRKPFRGVTTPKKLGLGTAGVWVWLSAPHLCLLACPPASFLTPLPGGGAAAEADARTPAVALDVRSGGY